MSPCLRALTCKVLLTGLVCVGMIWPAAALAGSVLYGRAGFETVKGRPGTFTGLHEWKLHLSADGGAIDGLYEHVATTSGAYDFSHIAGNQPVPAGGYSVYLDRANVWGRPTVIYNIAMPASGSVYLEIGHPTDYHAFFNGADYDVWGSSPWAWGTAWYQTFTAAGTSVTGITAKFVGVTATSVRMSIVHDNGGAITSWPTVGQTRTRPAGNGDVWTRFLSNEVPTVPGQRYALKLEGLGGAAGLGIYCRTEDGQGFAGGQAYDAAGNPQNFDLCAVVASDNDGTVIPYVMKVTDATNNLLDWAWSYQQSVRAVGSGLAGMVILSSGNPESATLRVRARSGSVTGPQIGPMKKSRVGLEAGGPVWAGVSWNPGEVPLTPGEVYYIEVTGDPPSSVGLSAHRFAQGENAYPDGHAYRDGTALTSVDLFMQVVEYSGEFDPPEIGASPLLFNRSVVRGADASSDTLAVWNSGEGLLSYTITDNAGWLSVDPSEGYSLGEADLIAVIYSTAGLAIGSYTANITITAPGATNTPLNVPVYLNVTTPLFAPCDFDLDGDVDQGDFGRFQTCYTGSGLSQNNPACQGAKLDEDDDVDLDDFSIFQGCISGPEEPADPLCAG